MNHSPLDLKQLLDDFSPLLDASDHLGVSSGVAIELMAPCIHKSLPQDDELLRWAFWAMKEVNSVGALLDILPQPAEAQLAFSAVVCCSCSVDVQASLHCIAITARKPHT